MESYEFKEILPVESSLRRDQDDHEPNLTTSDEKEIKLYKLNEKIQKFKSILEHPRYYVSNFFEDFRREVDLVGTRLTLGEEIILYPIQKKLTENWNLIINKVKSHEEECLKQLSQNQPPNHVFIQYAQALKQIELKLNNLNQIKNQNQYLASLDIELSNEMYNLKSFLFLNKSFVFVEEEQSRVEDLFKDMNMTFHIGKLICINEYFGKRGLSRISSKFNLSEDEEKQVTNESVKTELLVQILDKKPRTKTSIDEIKFDCDEMTKFDCNSKNLEVIDSKSFKDMNNLSEIRLYNNNFTNLDASLFQNLANLTSVFLSNNQLTKLDENIFKNLTNLTQIDLKYNKLEYLGANIFRGLKNLTHIYLSGNRLRHLDKNIFLGLVKLNGVYLSSNKLESLDPEIFQGLNNLIEIYLRENKLRNLDKNMFTGLIRLTYLRINKNKLEGLDSEIFRGLNNLTGLWLDDNRIKQLDCNLFCGLPKLELINLSNNKLINQDQHQFVGLNKSANIYCN